MVLRRLDLALLVLRAGVGLGLGKGYKRLASAGEDLERPLVQGRLGASTLSCVCVFMCPVCEFVCVCVVCTNIQNNNDTWRLCACVCMWCVCVFMCMFVHSALYILDVHA